LVLTLEINIWTEGLHSPLFVLLTLAHRERLLWRSKFGQVHRVRSPQTLGEFAYIWLNEPGGRKDPLPEIAMFAMSLLGLVINRGWRPRQPAPRLLDDEYHLRAELAKRFGDDGTRLTRMFSITAAFY